MSCSRRKWLRKISAQPKRRRRRHGKRDTPAAFVCRWRSKTLLGLRAPVRADLKRCSVCGHPFEPDVQPSMSVAFSDHLSKAHRPGQTSEDFSQAAVRVVKEATEKV